MELKELGGTGVMVPEIGLGTWKYSGGNEPLRRGIESGAFLIDTAEMYRTEDAVGRAVKGIRDRVFIATKVSGSNLRYDRVLRAAENSLRLLDTGYIDLYQIHWPNPGVPIAETMGAMEELVDAGKVKYIGVSNFSVRELAEAVSVMTRHPIVSNQVLYNLKRRDIEPELLPYCQQNNITVLAYTPLADGSLAVPAATSQEPGSGLRRTAGRLLGRQRGRDALQSVAADTGHTPAQVALNWCTAKPSVIAIPKSNSVARTEENCGASGWRLTEEHRRLLDEAFPV
ncbi:MAG TPA: aldo/keto reductase [Dehalococcoidia bacterium]|nr:aldo/keto reductase [Dehalococcoidia bacterium]